MYQLGSDLVWQHGIVHHGHRDQGLTGAQVPDGRQHGGGLKCLHREGGFVPALDMPGQGGAAAQHQAR